MVSISTKDTTFTKIFVGGLPYHTTDETLRKFFERFGDIDEAVVITDRATGKSRGYGFVTMSTKEAAQEAIKDPNPVIDGRKANVNLAYLGAKPRSAGLSNAAVAAAAAANAVMHLGGYPSLQNYGLQPLIYPAHTLLGSNLLPYNPAGTSLNQTTNPIHYPNTYDFANQYNQSQLDTSSFSYANSSLVAAAAAAAAAANVNSQANVANYAYAALAQHSLQPTLASYQQ